MSVATISRPRRSPARAPLPAQLRLLRAGLRATGLVSPRLAGRLTYRLFGSPRRHARPEREVALLGEARSFTVEHEGRRLAAWSWGGGPDVLLVHGWDGRGAQLGAFVAPLVGAGFRVTTFDAPAHGGSTGSRTNLFDVAGAVQAVAAALGPLHGIVAHSFGGAATTLALASGLAAGRVVYIAPASRLEGAIGRFLGLLDLPEAAERSFYGEFERRFGASIWERVAVARLAPRLSAPALVLHDPDDREVPFEDGARLADAWPGATLLRMPGLGHRRILWDERALAPAVGFVVDGRVGAALVG